MLRAASFALLVAFLMPGSLGAQRGSAGIGVPVGGLAGGSGYAGRGPASGSVSSRRPFRSRIHHHHNRFGGWFLPYWWPYEGPAWDEPYEQPEPVAEPSSLAIVQQPERYSAAPRLPAKSLVIEIPSAGSPTAATNQPPTVFILVNGEQLETRRFLLTAKDLSLTVDHRARIIPIEMLDIDETLAANRKRGTELRIPADQAEIWVRF